MDRQNLIQPHFHPLSSGVYVLIVKVENEMK